nr:thymidylate kinase [Schizosaccharomyces pombe]
MSKQNRGRLIVIEGLDRSGKSTQCQLLVDKLILNMKRLKLFKFPDRTTAIGKKIDDYLTESVQLNDQVIHLLFSANRWEPSIYYRANQQRCNCILDRYAFSGIAFSAAKGLDWEWCKSPDRGLTRPDLVIFLNVDPRIAATRGQYGEERYEKIEMQEKVLKNLQRLQKEFREEGLEFITLDASSYALEDVDSQIVDLVSNVNIHETLDVL